MDQKKKVIPTTFLKTVHPLGLVMLEWIFCSITIKDLCGEQTLASVSLSTSDQSPIPPLKGANCSAWMSRPAATGQPAGWEGDPVMCKAAVPKDKQAFDPGQDTLFAENWTHLHQHSCYWKLKRDDGENGPMWGTCKKVMCFKHLIITHRRAPHDSINTGADHLADYWFNWEEFCRQQEKNMRKRFPYFWKAWLQEPKGELRSVNRFNSQIQFQSNYGYFTVNFDIFAIVTVRDLLLRDNLFEIITSFRTFYIQVKTRLSFRNVFNVSWLVYSQV